MPRSGGTSNRSSGTRSSSYTSHAKPASSTTRNFGGRSYTNETHTASSSSSGGSSFWQGFWVGRLFSPQHHYHHHTNNHQNTGSSTAPQNTASPTDHQNTGSSTDSQNTDSSTPFFARDSRDSSPPPSTETSVTTGYNLSYDLEPTENSSVRSISLLPPEASNIYLLFTQKFPKKPVSPSFWDNWWTYLDNTLDTSQNSVKVQFPPTPVFALENSETAKKMDSLYQCPTQEGSLPESIRSCLEKSGFQILKEGKLWAPETKENPDPLHLTTIYEVSSPSEGEIL